MIAVDSILTTAERVVFIVLLLAGAGFALKTYLKRLSLIRYGREATADRETLTARLKRFFIYVPGQLSNIRTISVTDLGGAQHLVIFWSALLFSVYYVVFMVLGDGFGFFSDARESAFAHVFLNLVELMGLLLLFALWWGLARRIWMKPERLGPDFEGGLFLFISVAGSLVLISFFNLAGLRLSLGLTTHAGPVSSALAQLFSGIGAQVGMFHFFWWLQVAFILCFMIYIPYSDHQHAVFAPLNIFASQAKARERFTQVSLDQSYNGLDTLQDFTWKQLLELYGCAQCGRCQQACPAYAAGKDLSPKKVIQDLRIWLDGKGQLKAFWKKGKPDFQLDMPPVDRVKDSEVWACTTCMACVQACPAFVSALDKIVDLRRDRVLAKSRIYPEVTHLFRDLENFGDIFGKGKANRADWAVGHNINVLTEENSTDILLWVGCQSSFHDRGKKTVTKLVEILRSVGINLAILGSNESCCGDPFRRLGNEYQFQAFARKNIEQLKKLNFKRIVTYCPHCFNILKNEYPQLGGEFDVSHYTELFAELIRDGQLKMKTGVSEKIAYHDPCYLARWNDLEQGGSVITSAPGRSLQPLEKSGKETFCCGGGGGAMWMRESGGSKINELRVEQLTVDQPDVIATSCPYCIVMLEDGLQSLGLEKVQCKDLVEIVSESL